MHKRYLQRRVVADDVPIVDSGITRVHFNVMVACYGGNIHSSICRRLKPLYMGGLGVHACTLKVFCCSFNCAALARLKAEYRIQPLTLQTLGPYTSRKNAMILVFLPAPDGP